MKAIILIFLIGFVGYDPTDLKLNKSQSTMSINGTSSLHDWESIVNDFSVTGNISEEAVTELKVEVIVKSIESGKSIMDSKTFDALKEKEFPTISFQAARLKIDGEKISGKGTVNVAGQSKEISIAAKILQQSKSELKVAGEVNIVMSEFQIEPPKAMFGTLHTGDQVTIKYELLLNK